MYSLLRPLLFTLDPELAHHIALSALTYAPRFCFPKVPKTRVSLMGLDFPHPVGLAAGLDKNGAYLDALAKIGFSFIEVGTVTPRPQEGNSKPRLFRIPQAQAIINRMGFNNQGVDALVEQVKKSHYKGILGINIGKNKDTSLNAAAEDYVYCLRRVYEYASYITVNISSPNTPDLRQLQQSDYLVSLLSEIQKEQTRLSDQFQHRVPVVIKISPDEEDEVLKRMIELMLNHGISGVIVSNTTCSREGVEQVPEGKEGGGLSGKPLATLSTRCLRLVKQYSGNALALIGVGGIDDSASAQEKLDAGASLVQVYTGLIYQGPGLVQKMVSGLNVVKK